MARLTARARNCNRLFSPYGCEFCVDAHSKRALAHGASKQEIAETIAVAMFIAASSQIGWTNVYDKNIYDSIFEEKELEKPKEKKGCCCGD